jgi:hypothetical protein
MMCQHIQVPSSSPTLVMMYNNPRPSMLELHMPAHAHTSTLQGMHQACRARLGGQGLCRQQRTCASRCHLHLTKCATHSSNTHQQHTQQHTSVALQSHSDMLPQCQPHPGTLVVPVPPDYMHVHVLLSLCLPLPAL